MGVSSNPRKIYVVAGELSGDIHAAELLNGLKKLNPNYEFRGMAGDYCASAGMELHRHFKLQNVMGFAEILRHLPKLIRHLSETQKDIINFRPDAVVLVDYPGFNLRIAKFAFERNIPVYYYIPPQVWAWNTRRVKRLKKYCRHLFCILPFEEAFYRKYHAKVTYVGNPLKHQLQHSATKMRDQNLILLLPGSRPMEIKRTLPIMVQAIKNMHGYSAVIAGVSNVSPDLYSTLAPDIPVHMNQARQLMKRARVGMVCSGTATLEAALLGLPQVVAYAGNPFSVALARMLIKVPYISLVNLICNASVVPELIQENLNPQKLSDTLQYILNEGAENQKMAYKHLEQLLGDGDAASQTATLLHIDLNQPL
jgi:lipid-A-disaccharide synthase